MQGLVTILINLIICIIAIVICDKKKVKRKRGKSKEGKGLEFTKIILLIVLSTYFIGVWTGMCIVLREPEQLGVYLTYIATPTTAVVLAYCWKSKAENIIRMKNENPHIVESISEISNIQA